MMELENIRASNTRGLKSLADSTSATDTILVISKVYGRVVELADTTDLSVQSKKTAWVVIMET